jgi:uncharacterized protein (TIGR02145 family)
MKTTMSKQILFFAALGCITAPVAAQTVDVTLQCGQSYTINSTVAATTGAGLTYRWLENGSTVTGAAATYTVPATKSVGVYTYIRQARTTGCTDWQNSNAFTVEVKNKEGIDGVCFGGVMWAKYNVDEPGTFAATSDAPGKFYQFNRKTPYPASGTCTWTINSIDEDSHWIDENDPCPIGWRLPNSAELYSLLISINHVTVKDNEATQLPTYDVHAGPYRAAQTQDVLNFVTIVGGARSSATDVATHMTWIRRREQLHSSGAWVVAITAEKWWEGGDPKYLARPVRCVHD